MNFNMRDERDFNNEQLKRVFSEMENKYGWNITITPTPSYVNPNTGEKVKLSQTKKADKPAHVFSIRGEKKVNGTNMYRNFCVSAYDFNSFSQNLWQHICKERDEIENNSISLAKNIDVNAVNLDVISQKETEMLKELQDLYCPCDEEAERIKQSNCMEQEI